MRVVWRVSRQAGAGGSLPRAERALPIRHDRPVCYKTPMKLVIFDCDGTLVDSQHNITTAMAWAFEQHGLQPPQRPDILRCVGLSLPETFEVLAKSHAPSVQNSLAQHYRDAFHIGPLQRPDREEIYPGIRETIAALAARPDIALGVATGKSKRGVHRLFTQEAWHPHFHTIQTADDHPSKPHPSMITTAINETGSRPDTTIMIGDTTFDIEMAINAGVSAIGVGWGYHKTEHLTDAGAHDIVTDGARLLAAIDARLNAASGGKRS